MTSSRSSHPKGLAPINVPVLKMPPELALGAVEILGRHVGEPADLLAQRLHSLRRSIPIRTLVNAYVVPSLKELELYAGTLADGGLTRFGQAIYNAGQVSEERAKGLLARQLVDIDAEGVGLTRWLTASANAPEDDRKTLLSNFLKGQSQRAARTDREQKIVFDRLGKWLGYLVFFGVVREVLVGGRPKLSTDQRQLEALRTESLNVPPIQVQRSALLDAYSRVANRLGTRLYIPVAALRDEFGRILHSHGFLLTDDGLNEILRVAPRILEDRIVAYSPYSGPASGGLVMNNTYAGFISISPRSASSMTRSRKE